MESNKKETSNKVNDNSENKNSKQPTGKDEPKQNLKLNELKIELYPKNVPKGILEKRLISWILPEDTIGDSLDKNNKLAFLGLNVPILYGFYTAHCNHYPIRIKPDDIWLLIVQAFSNHVNANPEELREYFVNFEDKKTLKVVFNDKVSLKDVDKKTLEDFSIQINEQMKEFLGEEIIQNLTSDFSTTDYNSLIISKLSIMGAFQKYFNYEMDLEEVCGIPYIILEGTVDDYLKIKEKAENLSKYEFSWYINRIIPHIQKMIDAKMGKVDKDYFMNIIKRNEVKDYIDNDDCCPPEKAIVSNITGWILDFFAYEKDEYNNYKRFSKKSLKVRELDRLANQMLTVPFIIDDKNKGKTYQMNYIVGFIGCDQNEKKEVFPPVKLG